MAKRKPKLTPLQLTLMGKGPAHERRGPKLTLIRLRRNSDD